MGVKLSQRGDVAPFMVMDVMEAAARQEAAGHRVIHMEVGQPSTPAPRKVLQAAHDALDTQIMGYTSALGVPELRRRIAAYYAETAGIDIDPARVAVTAGSLGGFLLAFLAAFEHGDRVAMPRPSYPSYRNMLGALGLEPVWVETSVERGFQPTPEDLDRLEGPVHGLIIASPSNPVGSVIPPEALQRLVDYCQDRGIRLISDEIYHGISYGVATQPAVGYNAEVISLNSFSKYFSMTGWRLGWMVVPDNMIRQVERLAQNFFICSSAPAQYAALAAFDCREELDAHVAVYARNRQLLLEGLPQVGFTRIAPADGAFYLYADVSHLTEDSLAYAATMLEQAGVAATSGVDFDPIAGHRYLRFSYARCTEDMQEALRRLRHWQGGHIASYLSASK